MRLPQPANTPENNANLGDREPIPAGDYLAHIIKAVFKQTKKKTGHYLALDIRVLEGEHKGHALFSNLNLDNPNPVAVEIANKELNTICQALGKSNVIDSDELLQQPMIVTVIVKEGDANYPPSNEIVNYSAVPGPGQTAAPSEMPPTEPAQTTEPATDATPPASEPETQKLPWE
jgi:hypothetical protein